MSDININVALKRLGFVNTQDYLLEYRPTRRDPDGAPELVLTWLSETPQPSTLELAEAWAEHEAAAYRDPREAEYIRQLGKDPVPSFRRTVGDVLDTLIAQVYATALATDTRTADMIALVTKIAAIKAAHPKPA